MAIIDTRAWIEVSLDALRANYDTVRRRAGDDAAIIPMVKADAYGTGIGRAVRVFEPLGPWGYGVATAVEGATLRELGVTRPVLVAGPLPGADVDVAARARLTASISSMASLEAWRGAAERVGRPLDFHLDVDTGMGRTGFDWREVGEWGEAVGRLVEAGAGRIRWTGVFTHFHSADAVDRGSASGQWERFRQTLVQLPVAASELMVHVANSAAALRWRDLALDAVRPGIFLYGGRPAPGVEGVPEPATVMTVRARLAHVRRAASGTTAGYGATYTAAEPERWGTLSIGYGDGLPRLVGNRGHALVRGRRVPIIGRVSMDLTTVRLDGVEDAAQGDVVTLIGDDGEERITVDEVAEQAQTIGYEVLVGFGGSRLRRFEVGEMAGESERA
jgi:alanine racemase